MDINTNNQQRDVLIFWFETPPKVSKGAFNYVSKNWGSNVIYVINRDFPEYRKKTNWNDGDFGDAKVVFLHEVADEEETICQIFSENPEAIHVVAGFTTNIQNKISKYILFSGIKLVVFSELPVMMGNLFERFLRKIFFHFKYSKIRKKYAPYVKAFLPLGQLGCSTYEKYGWDKNVMYPFMYNPVISKIAKPTKLIENKVLKFLYVGRFYFKTKGIDTLMNATKYLSDGWQLDLVGGYGKDNDKVIKWAKNTPNVSFKGSWDSLDVCNNMMHYDVLIVPSKYDGWNLLPNEALHAGIGVITTNKAVSDELISASNAGLVVPANKPKELATAMQFAIDNPSEVESWKNNAERYVDRISSKTVGGYFIDILDFVFYEKMNERPHCPWI